jgi:hypothetical protein
MWCCRRNLVVVKVGRAVEASGRLALCLCSMPGRHSAGLLTEASWCYVPKPELCSGVVESWRKKHPVVAFDHSARLEKSSEPELLPDRQKRESRARTVKLRTR